ncbi:MAG: DNA-3-methyladenine glycosylase [Oscillospiraceae bacterium]
MIVKRNFFEGATLSVAEQLIGCTLISRIGGVETGGIIVETEGYLGALDPAAHSYKGKSPRVRVLYGQKGLAYIYLIYGMYWCLNFSTGPEGIPECVLIRALEPTIGIPAMIKRRGTDKLKNLCSGPGKLCGALGITGDNYGCDLCDDTSPLILLENNEPHRIERSARIGIDYAGDARDNLWRFTLSESPFVSK